MNKSTIPWHGYIPALTTPFDKDGSLDTGGWCELLEWIVSEGVHGVVVAGSSGEWPSLEPDERVELFRLAKAQVAKRVPVIGCCNGLRVREVRAYLQAAAEWELDGVLVAVPPYEVPSDEEILDYYRVVCGWTRLPVCIYNWPRGTGVDLAPAVVEQLAALDNVVAIKNSTRSYANFIKTFMALKDEMRCFGFGTDEMSIHLLSTYSGHGTIGGGAVLGHEHAQFFDAIEAGALDQAQHWAERDKRVFDFMMTEDFSPRFASAQAIMKGLLNLRGLPGGYPRPPFRCLRDEELERCRVLLSEMDVAPCR